MFVVSMGALLESAVHGLITLEIKAVYYHVSQILVVNICFSLVTHKHKSSLFLAHRNFCF